MVDMNFTPLDPVSQSVYSLSVLCTANFLKLEFSAPCIICVGVTSVYIGACGTACCISGCPRYQYNNID